MRNTKISPRVVCTNNYRLFWVVSNHKPNVKRGWWYSLNAFVALILYSKGKNTLCEDLGCDIEEVNRIFENVFGAYPVMKMWMDEMVAKAYEQGYVDNIYGNINTKLNINTLL